MTEKPGGPADLHVHTHFSDGKHSPADVVRMAAEAGIKILAITDHETVDGLAEAEKAGNEKGVEIVPGIEFAGRMGNGVEAHILGLWIDPAHPDIRKTIDMLQEERVERAEKMVARLQNIDVGVTMEDVRKNVGRGGIGRPHLAQALVDVAAVSSFKEAFKTLIGKDCPGYVPRKNLTGQDAIDIIRKAGGVSVLAHGLIGGPQREHVKKLCDMGIDAIEIYHPKLKKEQTEWLVEYANKNGLGVSGGSDWHGEGWSETAIGKYTIGMSEVERLKGLRPPGGRAAIS